MSWFWDSARLTSVPAPVSSTTSPFLHPPPPHQPTKQKLTSQQLEFARDDLPDGLSLLETAKQARPTVLLGLSACRGLFKEVGGGACACLKGWIG